MTSSTSNNPKQLSHPPFLLTRIIGDSCGGLSTAHEAIDRLGLAIGFFSESFDSTPVRPGIHEPQHVLPRVSGPVVDLVPGFYPLVISFSKPQLVISTWLRRSHRCLGCAACPNAISAEAEQHELLRQTGTTQSRLISPTSTPIITQRIVIATITACG